MGRNAERAVAGRVLDALVAELSAERAPVAAPV
jgi:hypothetical protein